MKFTVWSFTVFLWANCVLAAETTMINLTANGAISSIGASSASISADGRFVVFVSFADDLASGRQDLNGATDVFAFDRVLNFTSIISVDSSGGQAVGAADGPSISGTGRYVAFEADFEVRAPNVPSVPSVYVRDTLNNVTTLISTSLSGGLPNGPSTKASISTDGRYVAFVSSASNIIAGDTNASDDIFVADRVTGSIVRVSVASDGSQSNTDSSGASISGNGQYVVFSSSANNLVAADTNNDRDVFRHDLVTGTTVAVSKRTSVITFPGSNTPVTVDTLGNGRSVEPSISADGRFIAFATEATNLHEQTGSIEHVVLKDMENALAALELISRNSSGEAALGFSFRPSISLDAQYVYFESNADNLVPDDTNIDRDSFLLNRSNGHVERVTVANNNDQAELISETDARLPTTSRISADGRLIAFDTPHQKLVPLDTNVRRDVFLRDRGEPCTASLAGSTRILPSGEWLLAALPCGPPVYRNTVGDILADDITGSLGTTWAVFTYDATLPAPAYEAATLSTELTSGQGFWIQHITGSSVTLDMPEGSRQATGKITPFNGSCVSVRGCFDVALSGAPNTQFLWNLIGNPFASNISVAFDGLRVTTANGTCAAVFGCTMAEAASPAASIVFNRFFHYDGSGYVNRDAGSTLTAWEGYWVPELPLAEFNSPTIRFPR